MSTVALVVIATGDTYRRHAKNLIASAKQYFVPHDVVLFADKPDEFDVAVKLHRPNLGFPRATLTRYEAICGARETLSKYDYIFYSDADMLFVNPVSGDEIFADGIVATEHPGYHVRDRHGSPEKNPRSTAYLPTIRTYFCGGFNGGESASFLRMSDVINDAVHTDDANGILAVWHDESHLNRYLYDHPPALVLSPAFCYPEGYGGGYGWPADRYVPKLLALEKGSRIW
jgi:histo-blood group ABO system transferase